MTSQEFDVALASALRICRAAAAERLPFEGMLEYVYAAQDNAREGKKDGEYDAVDDELEALVSVIDAMDAIAKIGAVLPPEPTPIRVPDAPSGPAPVNIAREARG